MRTADQCGQWPLIGRDGELAYFADSLADPSARGFVIHGPRGVGKSRLAAELLERAVAAGFHGGRVEASRAAAAIPLGAIAHLLPHGPELIDPVRDFVVVAGALAGPGRRRWAILVDDLHLLDATSTVLLRQLMDTGLIRLIATVPPEGSISDAVQALAHGDAIHRVDLAQLGMDEVDALLSAVLGAPVDRFTLGELFRASDGNPLYLRELVFGGLAAGALSGDGEVWRLATDRLPGTERLTELISSHLEATTPAGRRGLELLALCEPLSPDDLMHVVSLNVLAELEHAGLVRSTQNRRRTTVHLAHALYGEVLIAGMSDARRRTLLLEQAERLEARQHRRRGDPLRIATWRLCATGTADPALLTRAATLARHAHDYAQVAALLRALPPNARTTTTHLVLGEALFQMGDWGPADEALAAADESAADEQDILAVALVRTVNRLWSNASFSEALALNDTTRLRVTSPQSHRSLRLNEGFLRTAAGQPAQGLALLEDLATDIGRVPNADIWLRGALMKPIGLALTGRPLEALVWAERAYDAHLRTDEQALVSHPATQLVSTVVALTEAGRLAEASTRGERAFADVGGSDTIVRAWMALSIGRAQWLAGRPRSARRWYAECAALARAIDHVMALRPALAGVSACAWLLGDLSAARAASAESEALPPVPQGPFSVGEQSLAAAWRHAGEGDLVSARAVLLEAAGKARATGHITAEALLLTDIARLGGAGEAAGRLAELAERSDGGLAPTRARFAQALAGGDPDALMRVADECEATGADLMAAEAAAAAAGAWRTAGMSRRATAATARAEAAAARCEGARTPLLGAMESITPLTVREREIAELVVSGLPVREIAATLGLSSRTIENHLHRTYIKLGVSTRSELTDTLGERSRAG
ncbi:LuxR C-terminal-related transcriptional regulator [Streptomyces sp. NPDC060223]|uniref:helix-turn-helix transcriptional regulator n=1 Tax=unclassified Streptomyces TaxID=2593676 RepID=UPI00362C55A1